MDSVQSFRGYGKVDEIEQANFRKKTRKRICIISISVILLVALVVGIVAGALAHNKKTNNSGDSPAAQSSAAIKSVCSVTQYPDTCQATLGSSNSSNPEKIFRLSLTAVLDSLQRISTFPGEFANRTNDPMVKESLAVCDTVINDAVGSLNDTVSAAQDKNSSLASIVDNLRTWLSAVVTDQETCSDALTAAGADFSGEVELLMKNSTELASNSLAIATRVLGAIGDFKLPGRRRLLGSDFPAWVDRRALQEARPDVTVSASGDGDVTTLKEAVSRIPKKSLRRFVIYVKAGVYTENIILDKSCWNVMIYGDGKNSTIVSGSKNFIDGTPTFATATFAVVGKGFIARDIGFRNTAGAAKHQAVAVRSGSDESVFYRCSFDAFQDTLYAHSNRQFYRECDITGTIDFIFGNAAVVFQSCNIFPRQPLVNQFVTITAQGKKDPNQNTGIVIQRCTMSPLGRLTAQTYLGRPWKAYSTTVVMETIIGGFLNPLGWISWVSNVDPPESIVYGEYRNTGPGADTAGRVRWAGYNPSIAAGEASKYSVGSFILGESWLPATSVKFDSD